MSFSKMIRKTLLLRPQQMKKSSQLLNRNISLTSIKQNPETPEAKYEELSLGLEESNVVSVDRKFSFVIKYNLFLFSNKKTLIDFDLFYCSYIWFK